jgi:hypothetical protein
MELAGCALNHHEVVMKAATMDKGTLVSPNKLQEKGRKPVGNHLSHPLGHTVNQTDRPEVPHLFSSRLLWKKGDERTVYRSKSTTIMARQGIERSHDVHSNNIPADHEHSCPSPQIASLGFRHQ